MKEGLTERRVRRQIRLVDLRPARDERGHHRRSDAASDIAHEVDQAGDAVTFLRSDTDVRCQVDGNEEESQAKYLHHPEDAGRSKADVEVQLLSRNVHPYGKGQPAEGNDVSRLELGCKHTCNGHQKQQQKTAAGKHQAGRLGCVTHQRLKKLRHHDEARKQHDSKYEHHEIRAQEVQILE